MFFLEAECLFQNVHHSLGIGRTTGRLSFSFGEDQTFFQNVDYSPENWASTQERPVRELILMKRVKHL